VTCHPFKVGDASGFICTRERKHRCTCGAVAGRQCDYPIAPKPGARKPKGTCDAHLCGRCATTWALTLPVQPDPAYRREHGGEDGLALDLCRVHAGLVRLGTGLGVLQLLVALRATKPGRATADRIEAARSLAERVAQLEGAVAAGERFLAQPDAVPAAAARVRDLNLAMGKILESVRAAGDPERVFTAEQVARAALKVFTVGQPALPGVGGA
jgi:hypothetical protein